MRKIDLNKERIFENKKQGNKNVRNNQNKFYWATEIPKRKHNFKTYNKISGKEILEIGCSNGSAARMYTKYCKSYFGLDISDEAIKIARSLNIKNANFLCVDAHNIPTEDSKFDCVIVNSILHPAGNKLFGTVRIRPSLDLTPTLSTFVGVSGNVASKFTTTDYMFDSTSARFDRI